MVICRTLSVRIESPLLVSVTKGLRNPLNYMQSSLSSPQGPKHTLKQEK